MNYRFVIGAVFSLLTLAAARTVVADVSVQVTFDTVDFVEIKNQDICSGCTGSNALVVIRGVPSGSSTTITSSFNFGTNKDMATRCERLAVIAMSKPGKYLFGIGANSSNPDGGHGDCRLTLVAP